MDDVLHTLKHPVRAITKLLDDPGIRKYPASQESHEVKHEVLTLLSELQHRSLLPNGVTISTASNQPPSKKQFRKSYRYVFW